MSEGSEAMRRARLSVIKIRERLLKEENRVTRKLLYLLVKGTMRQTPYAANQLHRDIASKEVAGFSRPSLLIPRHQYLV